MSFQVTTKNEGFPMLRLTIQFSDLIAGTANIEFDGLYLTSSLNSLKKEVSLKINGLVSILAQILSVEYKMFFLLSPVGAVGPGTGDIATCPVRPSVCPSKH